jgi:hypothetical protein
MGLEPALGVPGEAFCYEVNEEFIFAPKNLLKRLRSRPPPATLGVDHWTRGTTWVKEKLLA